MLKNINTMVFVHNDLSVNPITSYRFIMSKLGSLGVILKPDWCVFILSP